MKHEMKESLPKSWDKTKRVYEISYPSGKKEIWKDITARECLTKYENMDPFGNGLKLREIEGKELQLLKVIETGKNYFHIIQIFLIYRIPLVLNIIPKNE